MNNNTTSITPIMVLKISTMLRSLGLNPSTKGAKYLNITIQYIINNKIEFIILDNIYLKLSEIYNINANTFKANIRYALNNRNIFLSEKNFKNIFNFEYEEEYFEPKVFIELFIQLIIYKT